MLEDLYDFKNQLGKKGIFFCFSGPISQNLVREIGTILEQKLKIHEVKRTTVGRVFSMVVETAQNIMYYSAEKVPEYHDHESEEELSLGIITVGYEDDAYFVISGNMIENQKVPVLEKKLTELRGMSKERLKQEFKERVRLGPDEGSRGAGLGFIEMAKKAGKPIEFNFRKIDEDRSFFSVKIVT